MTTAATHQEQSTTTEAMRFVAFALREKTWKLGLASPRAMVKSRVSAP